ncbi:MAG: DUF4032 domain-containing protein [Bacteroidota bacterium]
MKHSSNIRFHVDPIFIDELKNLPWHLPIADWKANGVQMLDIKRGISRHTVVFVRQGRFSFSIKEISEEISKNEINHYEQLLLKGIHTLIPAGYVVREEEPIAVNTPVGIHYEPNTASHTVTLLVEKVLPDSLLYSRNFRKENRQKIWDAVVHLLVQLHSNGVYWGDASLANTLIKFEKREIPFVGKRTFLMAYLSDAETVEIRETLSQSMRESELNFFFESMDWMNEDLKASGVVRDDVATNEDKEYILASYRKLYDVELKKKRFAEQTSFNIDQFLGSISDPSYVDLFVKHIEEHKWYLGERLKKNTALAQAALDWYTTVFVPVCEMFRNEGILDLFPGKTAAELYIEIMTNKYYMSEKAGLDVGMIRAAQDYANRFGVTEYRGSLIKTIADNLALILGTKEK